MAIRFQYNKTALQGLNKQLRIRQHALPILKSKEAALRMEVKKGHFEVEELNGAMSEKQKAQQSMSLLWEEFDFNLVRIGTLHVLQRKIAGVSIPVWIILNLRTPHSACTIVLHGLQPASR